MSVYEHWERLGSGYPGEDPYARAVFDVLAPLGAPVRVGPPIYEIGSIVPFHLGPSIRVRLPVYSLGREEAPMPVEVWDLALKVTMAMLTVRLAELETRK